MSANPRDAPRTALSAVSLHDLDALFAGWGEPRYRAQQVFEAVQRRGVLDPMEMTTLPRGLRARLAEAVEPPATALEEAQESADGTAKLLLGLRSDGRRVETVIIPEDERRTVCVSTQVGCPIGCIFCASGVDGLVRNLTTPEIVEQVLHAVRQLGGRPSHVVVMGMGEPLLNLRGLEPALRLWIAKAGLGFSPRRITVSTASTATLVDRLADTGLRVNLAVSLHGADDVTRSRLVPTNRPGQVATLVDAAVRYARRTGRDATVEYVLIEGENDRPEDAEALARLLAGRHVHLNLIPLNPVDHRPLLRAPSGRGAQAFARRVERAGASVTLRSRRGDDIDAACGQLALKRTLGGTHDAPPESR